MIGQRTQRLKEVGRAGRKLAILNEDNYVAGHQQVKVAESQQPKTSLHTMHSIDFKSGIEDEIPPTAAAIGSSVVRRIRGSGTPGEMALKSIFVKPPEANESDGMMMAPVRVGSSGIPGCCSAPCCSTHFPTPP